MGYFLPVADYNVNRFFVMLSSIALIVLSALGLSAGGSTGHMIVNAVILAFAVLGFFGALTTDIRWLQLYLMMLAVLFVWELVWILVQAIGYKASLGSLAWDIALCSVLLVSACVTANLIRGTGFLGSASAAY